jgi:hypothetical protein
MPGAARHRSERGAARLARQSGGQRRDLQQASHYVVKLVLAEPAILAVALA